MYITVTNQKKTPDMLFILFGFFGGLTHFLFFSRAYWVDAWEAAVMACMCAMAAWSGTHLMKLVRAWYLSNKKRKR